MRSICLKKFHICLEFGLQRYRPQSRACHLAMFLKWIEHSNMWHSETRHLIRKRKTVINCIGAIVISPFRPLIDIVTIYKYIINWNLVRESAWVVTWPDRENIRIVTEEWTIGHWVETGMCKKLQGNGGFLNRLILTPGYFDNSFREVRRQLLKIAWKNVSIPVLNVVSDAKSKWPIKSANQSPIPLFLN